MEKDVLVNRNNQGCTRKNVMSKSKGGSRLGLLCVRDAIPGTNPMLRATSAHLNSSKRGQLGLPRVRVMARKGRSKTSFSAWRKSFE